MKQPSAPLWPFTAVSLLGILFLLLLNGAQQTSFTNDEPSHLAAGYAFLSRGQAGLWTMPLRGHPLLIDTWVTLPLYIGKPDLPVETLSGWGENRPAYAQSFIQAMGSVEDAAMAARVPAILLTLLLGANVYRWATDLWGARAGALALGILVFDPTLLGHGCLATNDIGVTALGTLTLYLVWRWAERPSWLRAIATGVIAGLTALSKGSGLLWFIVVGEVMLWRALVTPPTKQQRLQLTLQSFTMGILVLTLIWAMYGFDVGPLPGKFPLSVPAPMHWRGLFYHTTDANTHTVFALGEQKQGNWWWYFPLAFLLKNPVPLLLSGLLGIGMRLRHRERRLHHLGVFVPLYLLAAVTTGPNIGYRHLLPIHPFLYLLVTHTITQLIDQVNKAPDLTRHAAHLILVLMGGWYVAGTLRVYPHTIAYFNELIGGSKNGWRYLASSNTDWCQGWKTLEDWQTKTGITFGFSGSTGYLAPKDYGVSDYWLLPPTLGAPGKLLKPWLYPKPGNYIIGANTLSGLGVPYIENYSWFRYHQPDAMIANSHFYYRVPAPLAPTWLAQCNQPAIPLQPQAITEGFGDIAPRQLSFDCTQTWVYPNAGLSTGWYALHDQLLLPESKLNHLYLASAQAADPFADHHLHSIPQSIRQWNYRTIPAFALYEWQPGKQARPEPQIQTGYPAIAETAPQALPDEGLENAPWIFNNTLAFLGMQAWHSEQGLEVETWWQMRSTEPITRPFSIMAHLLTPEGTVLEVADGLGFSPLMLQAKDIFVQRHQFEAIPSKQEIWLRTGIYWLDNNARWSIQGPMPKDALFVPFTQPKHEINAP